VGAGCDSSGLFISNASLERVLIGDVGYKNQLEGRLEEPDKAISSPN
jgi:hypothetical protein